jgi:dihydrofolate reductase
MTRLTLGLCAATVTVALLAGCGPDRPPRPGNGTDPPTTAVRSTRPPDNGIAARPAKEILAASERAFRSARSVQVKVAFKDRAGVVKANLTLTHKHGMAAGWFEQQGARVTFVVAGARFYFRGRRFWEKQGNAELAALIGDRWVLVPGSVAGELTPFGNDFTIDGLADELFKGDGHAAVHPQEHGDRRPAAGGAVVGSRRVVLRGRHRQAIPAAPGPRRGRPGHGLLELRPERPYQGTAGRPRPEEVGGLMERAAWREAGLDPPSGPGCRAREGFTSATEGAPTMRELIVTQNITLDGVIDAAGGWFDPSGNEGADHSDVIAAVAEAMATTDALLVGRVTFEQLRGYWPRQADDATGVRDHLNQVDKHVASKTLQDPGWEGTTVLRGPLLDEVRELKAQPGKAIVATGSLSLMPELVAGGVVDEYQLFVHPVVLGRGQRLFADATNVPRLQLVEARPFRSGIVLLRYRTSAST